jgi:hypothetical protein
LVVTPEETVIENEHAAPSHTGVMGNVDIVHSADPVVNVQIPAVSLYPATSVAYAVWDPAVIEENVTGFTEDEVPESTRAVVPEGAVLTVSSEPTRLIRTEPDGSDDATV